MYNFVTFPSRSYHLMQNCWKQNSSERPHFQQIVMILTSFLDHLNKCENMYCESDSGEAPDFTRQGSESVYCDSDSDKAANIAWQSSGKTPSRTPSIQSGDQERERDLNWECVFRNGFLCTSTLTRTDTLNIHYTNDCFPSAVIVNLFHSSSMELQNGLQPHGSFHRQEEHSAYDHQFSVSCSDCKCKCGCAHYVGGSTGA